MTQTGMMIGTMEYMSPEQAMGKDLDARSDEFAVGLIFYELLTGFMPYQADSAIASLVKRTQERVPPAERSRRDDFRLKSTRLYAAAWSAILTKVRFRSRVRSRSWKSGKAKSRAAKRRIASAAARAWSDQNPALPLKWLAIGVCGLVLAVGASWVTLFHRAQLAKRLRCRGR